MHEPCLFSTDTSWSNKSWSNKGILFSFGGGGGERRSRNSASFSWQNSGWNMRIEFLFYHLIDLRNTKIELKIIASELYSLEGTARGHLVQLPVQSSSGHVQSSFECPQGQGFHHISGQLFKCFNTYSKFFFPFIESDLSTFLLASVASHPSTAYHCLSPSFLHPPFR